jgi:hypothetical protein
MINSMQFTIKLNVWRIFAALHLFAAVTSLLMATLCLWSNTTEWHIAAWPILMGAVTNACYGFIFIKIDRYRDILIIMDGNPDRD